LRGAARRFGAADGVVAPLDSPGALSDATAAGAAAAFVVRRRVGAGVAAGSDAEPASPVVTASAVGAAVVVRRRPRAGVALVVAVSPGAGFAERDPRRPAGVPDAESASAGAEASGITSAAPGALRGAGRGAAAGAGRTGRPPVEAS
jgi:hypothetical protein